MQERGVAHPYATLKRDTSTDRTGKVEKGGAGRPRRLNGGPYRVVVLDRFFPRTEYSGILGAGVEQPAAKRTLDLSPIGKRAVARTTSESSRGQRGHEFLADES